MAYAVDLLQGFVRTNHKEHYIIFKTNDYKGTLYQICDIQLKQKLNLSKKQKLDLSKWRRCPSSHVGTSYTE